MLKTHVYTLTICGCEDSHTLGIFSTFALAYATAIEWMRLQQERNPEYAENHIFQERNGVSILIALWIALS